MSRRREDDRKVSFRTEQKAGEYLFSMEDMTTSEGLDMRSRIQSEDTMRALLFYSILGYNLKCDAAKAIKDTIERMLIARGGKGRAEGVAILQQAFPKIREVSKGSDFEKYLEEDVDPITE